MKDILSINISVINIKGIMVACQTDPAGGGIVEWGDRVKGFTVGDMVRPDNGGCLLGVDPGGQSCLTPDPTTAVTSPST